MLSSLPPRSYPDLTVPERADGTALVSCNSPDDYPRYVHWLADYLHTAQVPLTPAQEVWLQALQPTAHDVIFQCSDSLGYATDQIEDIESFFTTGGTWLEYLDMMQAAWDSANDVEHDETFEEWLDMTEARFERLRVEWNEKQKFAPDYYHADIPFRSLLAWALRQIPDHEERFREMDWYFRNFSDNASK
jgi:hypothetical protein